MFAIPRYLRYGYHVRGRRAALPTIPAFALFTLVTAHTGVQGAGP